MTRGTRERILDAAAECFSSAGFHGTSTKDIAKKADVNETTLFRIFQDKDHLFDQAVEMVMQGGLMVDAPIQPLLDEPSFKKAIHRCVEAFSQMLSVPLLRLEFFAALERPSTIEEPLRRSLRHFCYEVAARIHREQQAGRANKSINAYSAALALNNIIFHHFVLMKLFRINKPGDCTFHDRKHMVDLWLRGVLAHRASKHSL